MGVGEKFFDEWVRQRNGHCSAGFDDFKSAFDRACQHGISSHLLFSAAKLPSRNRKGWFFASDKDAIAARLHIYQAFSSYLRECEGRTILPASCRESVAVSDMLQVKECEDIRRALLGMTLGVMNDVCPSNLVDFLKETALHGHYPGDDWMWAWGEAVDKKFESFLDNEILDIVNCLAMLDFFRSRAGIEGESPCRQMGLELLKAMDSCAKDFFPENIMPSQIVDAALWFDYTFQHSFSRHEDYVNRASPLEKRYKDAFVQAGLLLEESAGAGQKEIDICGSFCRASKGGGNNAGRFGIEIDGGVHFLLHPDRTGLTYKTMTYDGMTYHGRSKFQQALQHRRKGTPDRVIHIPDPLFERWRGKRFSKVATHVLGAVGDLEPGSYIFHNKKDFRRISDLNALSFRI